MSAARISEAYIRAFMLALACAIAAVASAQTPLAEAAYLAENDAAMDKMMKDMAVKASGDVDRDFATMMIPHHQGAVDMAIAYLRYGRNEQLRRLAQEIIVTQQQEIAVMRLVIGDHPTGEGHATHDHHHAAPAGK